MPDRYCRTLIIHDEQGKALTASQAASATFSEGRIGPPFYGGFGDADQRLSLSPFQRAYRRRSARLLPYLISPLKRAAILEEEAVIGARRPVLEGLV